MKSLLLKTIPSLKALTALLALAFIPITLIAQDYHAYYYLGFRRSMGVLHNPYTNEAKDRFDEKIGISMIEMGAEGMSKTFYVNFRSDFFGVLPDYIFLRALNKNNTATIYGESLDKFHEHYNKPNQGGDPYYASFSDWDVMGGNLAWGYKYAFVGGNFAWGVTQVKAYQLVSNTKIRDLAPPDYYSFSSKGSFTYGLNFVLGNNKPTQPIRLIAAYDKMLLHYDKWKTSGTRLTFDLQGNIPMEKIREDAGFYLGIIFRTHDIDYPVNINGMDDSQKFTSSIIQAKVGIYW